MVKSKKELYKAIANPMGYALKTVLERVDFKEKASACIEERLTWHVNNLKSIAKNIADATKAKYNDSYKAVEELLFIDSDTNSLIYASKSCGAIEVLFSLADELKCPLPKKTMALKKWGQIINPSD